jgi:Tol biopolymer transport system component
MVKGSMPMARFVGFCGFFLLLVATSVEAQQIVFSRRVYAARGTTFQQLWLWSASDGRLTQLTESPRDHARPVCSADGTRVFFDSGTDPLSQRRWRLDRVTGSEQPLSGGEDLANNAVAARPNVRMSGCDDRTWSVAHDGLTAVCTANGQDLVFVDLRTRMEIDRIRFDQRYSTGDPYPPWSLQSFWSPNGRTLLVGTYGEYGSSTTGELDFFLLDLPTRQWTRAMTGNNPVWLPSGDAIIYEAPRELVPLVPNGRHKVWTAHLGRFDLASRTETPLTFGVTNNVDPKMCIP